LALVVLAAWGIKLIEQGGPLWGRLPAEGSRLRTLLGVPLVGLAAGTALLYLVSTLFSITPFTSLWGSYQRLQGAYSTLAYIVIFASLAGNLRRRAQVERLITTAVLASLPVSLYGILQRFGADPIPWGGDVTNRIASNLGNSIFVAAYLIMIFPLAAMRIVEAFEALLTDRGRSLPNFLRATGYVFIGALQLIAIYFSGSRGPWLGLFASAVLMALGLSLVWRQRWMTISGVVLALTAGTFLVLLNIPGGPLESLRNRPEFGRLGQLLDAESRTGRVRVLIWSGAAELVAPHAPLEYPEGGQDTWNFLRPLIGYGPESMYVAYNPFYPPELTQVERRNASPDRSHNETWDSLVITGVLGLAMYLGMFGSVIYFGLKWLGMVDSRRKQWLFLALLLLGGAGSTIGFVAYSGVAYLGVALPFGMIAGLIVYLILVSLAGHSAGAQTTDDRLRGYLLIGLVAAVVAHFVEINFGIAIAATRLNFWVDAGLILAVGYLLPLHGEYRLGREAQANAGGPAGETLPAGTAATEAVAANPVGPAAAAAPASTTAAVQAPAAAAAQAGKPAARASAAERKSGGRTAQPAARKKRTAVGGQGTAPVSFSPWVREALIGALVVAILLTCLGYNFISNASRSTSALELIWVSLTTSKSSGEGTSYALLALFGTTWLVAGLVLASEALLRLDEEGSGGRSPGGLAGLAWLSLGAGLLAALVFWVAHAGGLAALNEVKATTLEVVLEQVRRSEGIISGLYIYLFLLILAGGLLLPTAWPAARARWQAGSLAVAGGLAVLVMVLVSYTNLRIIQADIAFKTGDLFARPDSWPAAIRIYDRARTLAPSEDYYYLFLGRAYLEYAKTLTNDTERENLIRQAAGDLVEAQRINPLNTDHTANLARLYSLWATYTNDSALRQQRSEQSDHYFSRAVVLSPNSARLWDEWAVHAMNNMDQPEQARARIEQALKIDPYYDWSYGLMADYYNRFAAGREGITPEQKNAFLIEAADYYTRAAGLADPAAPSMVYGYLVAYGGLQATLGNPRGAIVAYERGLAAWPENPELWRVNAALAQLYAQVGDQPNALAYAQAALQIAPEDQKAAVQNLVIQFGGQPQP
ncbi:MAG: hypothetical protein ACKOC5_16295, partial [Chloroflexota bacterium]